MADRRPDLLDACEPTGSTLREVRRAVCSDVVTGMLWHNAALATLGCVLGVRVDADWLLRFGRSAAEAADARAVDRGEEAFDWESDPEKTPPRRLGRHGDVRRVREWETRGPRGGVMR